MLLFEVFKFILTSIDFNKIMRVLTKNGVVRRAVFIDGKVLVEEETRCPAEKRKTTVIAEALEESGRRQEKMVQTSDGKDTAG